jgi:hypothetical protein
MQTITAENQFMTNAGGKGVQHLRGRAPQPHRARRAAREEGRLRPHDRAQAAGSDAAERAVIGAGLTLNQVVHVVHDLVPTDHLGELLKRLPAKYADVGSGLFRPVAPAVLAALDLIEPCDENDTRLADLVELAAADPCGAPQAWTMLPDGSPLYIGQLLGIVAKRLAALYAPTARRRTSKKLAPVA